MAGNEMVPGVTVRQVVPAAQGVVEDIRWNGSAKDFEVLVGYTMNGEAHKRWFLRSEVEIVEVAQ